MRPHSDRQIREAAADGAHSSNVCRSASALRGNCAVCAVEVLGDVRACSGDGQRAPQPVRWQPQLNAA